MFWTHHLLSLFPQTNRPILIGINGPQGAGKSTLTQTLVEFAPELGFRAATLSIDDFYLTRENQIRLARQHPLNPFLQQRGYPGTHDIPLGVKVLHSLKEIHQSSPIRVPMYDKSKHQGQGDRLDLSEWREIHAPLDVVFLEGWMLGFRQADAELFSSHSADIDHLLEINRLLRDYTLWHELLDGFIQLRPQAIRYVIDWRIEAEERMKKQGKPGMSRQEITNYVMKFLPAYEIFLPRLTAGLPMKKNSIQITLGKDRLPI